jgi:hypothetical protein
MDEGRMFLLFWLMLFSLALGGMIVGLTVAF